MLNRVGHRESGVEPEPSSQHGLAVGVGGPPGGVNRIEGVFMLPWGVTTLRVLDLLENIGPMTRSELSQRLGIDRQNLASVMSRLTKPSLRPAGPRRVHIGGWQDDGAPGERRYLRAIYALGDKPDKRRPASSKERQLEAKRAYWHRRKGRATVSVFALGQVGLGR